MTEPPVPVPPSEQARLAERGPTVPAQTEPGAPRDPPRLALGAEDEGGEPERPRVDVDTLRRVYLDLALPLLSAEPPTVAGYRLLRVLGRRYSWIDVPIVGGECYAVLGSHRDRDLVLTDDVGSGTAIWRQSWSGCSTTTQIPGSSG